METGGGIAPTGGAKARDAEKAREKYGTRGGQAAPDKGAEERAGQDKEVRAGRGGKEIEEARVGSARASRRRKERRAGGGGGQGWAPRGKLGQLLWESAVRGARGSRGGAKAPGEGFTLYSLFRRLVANLRFSESCFRNSVNLECAKKLF